MEASKPVSVIVPRGVAMTTGVPPSAASCAGVTDTPPTCTLPSPSGVPMTKRPVVVSLASPLSPRPRSFTVAWPMSPPLPSTICSVATSLRPWTVRVSVATDVSPSASVIV